MEYQRDRDAADAASLAPKRATSIDCSTKPPDPEQLVQGLLYEGGRHWLSGHPKDGKSIVALYLAVEHMPLPS